MYTPLSYRVKTMSKCVSCKKESSTTILNIECNRAFFNQTFRLMMMTTMMVTVDKGKVRVPSIERLDYADNGHQPK